MSLSGFGSRVERANIRSLLFRVSDLWDIYLVFESYFLFSYFCLSFLIFRAWWVEVVVSSQSDSHKVLIRKHQCCYYHDYYMDLLRLCAECLLPAFEYIPSSTLSANSEFMDDKTEPRKGCRWLSYVYVIRNSSEIWFELGPEVKACKFVLHSGPYKFLTVSSSRLPLCALRFTVQRGTLFFYLKEPDLILLGNSLWISKHPGGLGRDMITSC